MTFQGQVTCNAIWFAWPWGFYDL